MSWIGDIFKRGRVGAFGGSEVIGTTVNWYGTDLRELLKHGYAENDIVFSAVNMVMDKARAAPWILYEKVDESSLKSYRAIMSKKDITLKDWKEAQQYRTKALVEVEKFTGPTGAAAKKISELLQWANPSETFSDVTAATVGYQMLLGNAYWDGNNLEEGADEGLPDRIINLPPQMVKILIDKTYPITLKGYKLEAGFYPEPIFLPARILHLKLWNPFYDLNGRHLYGFPPLQAASKLLQRNNAAKRAAVQAYENGGAVGVLSVDDPRVNPEQAEAQLMATKAKWDAEVKGQFGKVVHTPYPMRFTKITDALADMQVSEIEDLDLRRLFNIWGIPSQLGNDPSNKTYNNQKEAEKALTSRCVIPKLNSIRDSLNYRLTKDWGLKGTNYYADFDATVYPEMQEDIGKKWETVKQYFISNKAKMEEMGVDVDGDNPAMEEILIPKGFERLEDVAGGIDLPDDEYNSTEDKPSGGENLSV